MIPVMTSMDTMHCRQVGDITAGVITLSPPLPMMQLQTMLGNCVIVPHEYSTVDDVLCVRVARISCWAVAP